jgi:hypothetical protein
MNRKPSAAADPIQQTARRYARGKRLRHGWPGSSCPSSGLNIVAAACREAEAAHEAGFPAIVTMCATRLRSVRRAVDDYDDRRTAPAVRRMFVSTAGRTIDSDPAHRVPVAGAGGALWKADLAQPAQQDDKTAARRPGSRR